MPMNREESPVESPPRRGETIEVDNRPCIFVYITAITRTWGILTCAAVWYLTVRLLQHREDYVYTPWYALGVSIAVTFLESVWIITKCACCRDDGNCCCTCWRIVLWLDNWKKAILYVAIALPTFSKGIAALHSVIIGILILVLAAFYLLKTIKYSECVKSKRRQLQYVETESPRAGLVSHEVQTSSAEYAPAGQAYATISETAMVKTETSSTVHSVQPEISKSP